MTRDQILAEIVRTTEANGGIALGIARFRQETGIVDSDWLGRYWARWSDAVKEAGCIPSTWQQPLDEKVLIERFVGLIRELGHVPVKAELQIKAKQDPTFPSYKAYSRLGAKSQFLARLTTHCQSSPELADVLAVVEATATKSRPSPLPQGDAQESPGYVYLLRADRYFKVGRSNSFDRRSRELAIQLPERAETVHVIHTDDAAGIEAYWHRRFSAKRKNGEWFELTANDVKAFKRRKFM